MNCTLCKQEIELNQEATIRNDHVYHVCCAITFDKGETDDGYQNPCHTASCIPDGTFTISNQNYRSADLISILMTKMNILIAGINGIKY